MLTCIFSNSSHDLGQVVYCLKDILIVIWRGWGVPKIPVLYTLQKPCNEDHTGHHHNKYVMIPYIYVQLCFRFFTCMISFTSPISSVRTLPCPTDEEIQLQTGGLTWARPLSWWVMASGMHGSGALQRRVPRISPPAAWFPDCVSSCCPLRNSLVHSKCHLVSL